MSNQTKLASLMALFTAFPKPESGEGNRQLAEVYMLAVDDIPAEAVSKAAQAFIKGSVDRANHTFRPTPPELAKEARRHIREPSDFAKRVAKYKQPRISPPKEKTEAERAAVVKAAYKKHGLRKFSDVVKPIVHRSDA